ncbi:MAG: thiamine diphosphokinase [Bacillus sp. (in: firmicutes)]
MTTIHIMSGGPSVFLPDIKRIPAPDIWVGVDKGVSTLLDLGIKPDAVFGDFDSIDESHRWILEDADFPVHRYAAEKDDPDLALALDWACKKEPDLIRIFGNTGGRMDHTLGGIQLLISDNVLNSRTTVCLLDSQNVIFASKSGVHTIEKDRNFKYISFFPMGGEVTGLTLKGFRYPLDNHRLPVGSTLCISNELISEIGTYSFDTGILLVVRSTDKSL